MVEKDILVISQKKVIYQNIDGGYPWPTVQLADFGKHQDYFPINKTWLLCGHGDVVHPVETLSKLYDFKKWQS